jgi:hypothetical protein
VAGLAGAAGFTLNAEDRRAPGESRRIPSMGSIPGYDGFVFKGRNAKKGHDFSRIANPKWVRSVKTPASFRPKFAVFNLTCFPSLLYPETSR